MNDFTFLRNQRGSAAEHLAAEVGNSVTNEQGRSVERVDMAGGKYLCFDERGEVDGFRNLSQALDYLGLGLSPSNR